MKNHIYCRQCGRAIVWTEWGSDYHAQQRGFCIAQHEEEYDKLHALEYQWARRQSKSA